MNWRRWWGRLAFSFLIIAAVIAYEGRRAKERGESPTARYGLAAVFAAAGIIGIRQRHNSD